MAEYYKLLVDTDRRDLMRVTDYDLNGFDYRSIWLGKPLDPVQREALSKVILFVSKSKTAGDYINNPLGWPIASQRFSRVALSLAATTAEAYPVNLISHKDKERVPEYECINVTALLPCIDLQRSRVSYDDEDRTSIAAIYDFTLLRNSIPNNVHLFRAVEWPVAIFVSRILAKALTDAQVTGTAYLECDLV
jgi:hypothetical protein